MCSQKLLALLLIAVAASSAEDDPIANTPLGKVRGSYMTSRSGRKFMAFTRIPYAKPPIGNLAFQAPQPVEAWNDTLNATSNLPVCVQYFPPDIMGTIDCLYLSVFTHNVSGKAPVLVYIHGGAFMIGNGNTEPEYLMDEDILIVSINYRVGLYGFLSFGDSDLPGNQGMKDQVESLHWVQKNIVSFGGDPNSVTIMGESAGGASISHHIISPLTNGLFHKAISESGASYDLWSIMLPEVARSNAMDVLTTVGCTYNTTKLASACLTTKKPIEVLKSFFNYPNTTKRGVTFLPVFEAAGPNAYLTAPVKSWEHHQVPLLIGHTSGEGIMISMIQLNENKAANLEKLFPTVVGYLLTASNPQTVTNEIHKFYFPNSKVVTLDDDWCNVTNMYTDGMFGVGILEMANRHPGDVYFYYLDYVGEYDPGRTLNNDSLLVGAFHAAEMLYLWKKTPTLNNEDLTLSKKLVKLWTDFIKHGNPVSNGTKGITWNKWTKEKNQYLHISKEGLIMTEGLNIERNKFWKSINFRDKIDNYLVTNSSYTAQHSLLLTFIMFLLVKI